MIVQFLFDPEKWEVAGEGLVFEMPGVPMAGDGVSISRPGQEGCTNFIVRRTCWDLDYPEEGPAHRYAGESVIGTTNAVTVECEFVVGPYSSEEHKKAGAGRVK